MINVSSSIKKLDREFHNKLLREFSDMPCDGDSLATVQILSRDEFSNSYHDLTSKCVYFVFQQDTPSLGFFHEEFQTDLNYLSYSTEDNLSNLKEIINHFLKTKEETQFLSLLKRAEKDSKFFFKLAKSFAKKQLEEAGQDPIIQDLMRFQEEVFLDIDKEEISISLIKFLDKKWKNRYFKAYNQIEEFDFLLPLGGGSEVSFIGIIDDGKRSFTEKDSFIIYYVLSIYNNFLELQELSKQAQVKDSILAEAFSCVDIPIALFSKNGDLYHYNTQFIDLRVSARDCLKHKNGQTLKIKDKKYLCYKEELSDDKGDYIYIAFLSGDDMNPSDKIEMNPQELGIITSSMAHELNNPMAGILAAVTLLRMEDFWSEDQFAELEEIEKSAKRCKSLVEIFLGFSQTKQSHSRNTSLLESFQFAQYLLNFRVVETNIKLAINWSVDREIEQNFPLGGAIFSMSLYLIFGAMMTSFSHQSMVEELKDANLVLNGEVRGQGKEIIIIADQNFSFLENAEELQLVKHLLRIQRAKLTIKDDHLIIEVEES